LAARRPRQASFPAPALAWLERTGATIRLAHRVERMEHDGARWRVDGDSADCVVIAASAVEAARLVAPHSAAWAAISPAPCATSRSPPSTRAAPAARLPEPMLALHPATPTRPAQFVFDRGRLGGEAGTLAFVISGAALLGRARYRRAPRRRP
jgi:hypothetical protein